MAADFQWFSTPFFRGDQFSTVFSPFFSWQPIFNGFQPLFFVAVDFQRLSAPFFRGSRFSMVFSPFFSWQPIFNGFQPLFFVAANLLLPSFLPSRSVRDAGQVCLVPGQTSPPSVEGLIFFCLLFFHQGKKRRWGFRGQSPATARSIGSDIRHQTTHHRAAFHRTPPTYCNTPTSAL